jgi:hypothetical protein
LPEAPSSSFSRPPTLAASSSKPISSSQSSEPALLPSPQLAVSLPLSRTSTPSLSTSHPSAPTQLSPPLPLFVVSFPSSILLLVVKLSRTPIQRNPSLPLSPLMA